MRIAIIGCGNMGLAFAKSFIKYDLVQKSDLLLVEKSKERCESLSQNKQGVVVNTVSLEISGYDLVILAVKPQDFMTLAPELKTIINERQVILSIMAGIPIKKIQEALGHHAVVRAMPNTPAMLGMGITGFTAAEGIGISKLFKIENLINATGRSVYIEDEAMIDAVTALSGSGPAYFYYFVKHMVEAGKQMGFDESTALQFVKQTMLGAYHLINNADMDLDDLIKAVASKGGTTEAALNTFQSKGFDVAIVEGILAAERRAKELSN